MTGIAVTDEDLDVELPCEPAGHGEIATGSVSSCSPLWRTFVSSPVVMQRTEHDYRLLWTSEAPQQREMSNAPSTLEHHEFVTTAIAEMVTEKAITMLPPGEKP